MCPVLLILLLANLSKEADTNDIVYYGAKRIIYYPEEEQVLLLCSAWVKYEDYKITSCSILYNLKTQILSAYKDAIFTSSTESVAGYEFHFNVAKRKGVMKGAKTRVFDGYLWGEEIWLIKEKTLHSLNCYYTTCSLKTPHYHFFSPKTKVLIDDMAIVQPISLHLWNMKLPIAAAPFWFFPVSEKRKSGLMPFKVGRARDEGFYAKRIAYYWVINDYSDLTFYLDVMQKKGVKPMLEGVYIIRPIAEGKLLTSFIRESARERKINRFFITGQHRSKFFFKSNLSAKIDYQSDAAFISDYAEERIEWLKQEILSVANLERSFKNFGKTALYFQHKKDFFKNREEFILPNFSIALYRRPLVKRLTISPSAEIFNRKIIIQDTTRFWEQSIKGSAGLSLPPRFLGNFNFGNALGFKRERSESPSKVETKSSFYSKTNFSFYQSFFGGLNFSENLGYHHRLDFRKDSVVPSVNYPLNISGNITLYRIFELPSFMFRFLSLKYILHTLVPSFGYSYHPRVRYIGLYGLPDLKEKPQLQEISLNLGNNFQGKFIFQKEKKELKREIMSINLGTSYSFLFKKVSPLTANGRLIIFDLPNLELNTNFGFVIPLETLFLIRNLSFVNSLFLKTPSFSIANFKATLCSLQISLDHNISGDEHMLKLGAEIGLTGWQFGINRAYNFKLKQQTDYSISIYKDLHCWEAVANISGLGLIWRYDFRVRIKKIPEVAIGKDIFGFILR